MPDSVSHERLVEVLAALFEPQVRRRGAEYARAGRIELIGTSADHARARVTGETGSYTTTFECQANGHWTADCSCQFFRGGARCKHLWGLAVVLDEAGWRFEGSKDHLLQEAKLVRPSAWRARLQEIRSATREASEHARPAREERLVYFLRLDLSGTKGVVVVETRRSQRRKDGSWSNPTPFAPYRFGGSANLPDEDRRILGLLKGATAGFYLSSQRTFELDDVVAQAVLPLMAERQALLWSDGANESPAPLPYEAEPPWHLHRTLRETPVADEWLLDGQWRRGDQVVNLRDALAVLPGGFIVFPDRIGRLADRSHAVWARALVEGGPLLVPSADRHELLRELVQSGAEVEFDQGVAPVRRGVAPQPRLSLDAPAVVDGEYGQLVGRVTLAYEGVPIAVGDQNAWIERGAEWIARDHQAEGALLRRPVGLGANPAPDDPTLLKTELDRVAELVRTLTSEGWIVEGEGARYRAASATRVSVKSGIDWFDIEGVVEFGGASATVPALLTALRRKERTVRLGDGTIGVLPEEWLARFGSLVSLGQPAGDTVRFKGCQAWLIDAMLAKQGDARVDAKFRARLDQFRSVEAGREPEGFQGELRRYQREGLGWLEFLERHGIGGCLADDMGLGKTVQVLAWLVGRSSRRGERAPTLVVAPKSLTHNWIAEAKRFAPRLSVLDYTGQARRSRSEDIAHHDIVVTTYGTLRNDIERLGDEHFDCVILDEAQAIKNADSLTAKAARLLQADYRIALSGTPIENHLGELWSLFEFLNPGMLGRSSVFSDLVASSADAVLGRESRELLSRVIKPFVLRRTKEQVLPDLPQKTEQTVTCELEGTLRREYDELRQHYQRILLEGPTREVPDSFTVLEALLRLRQAACHPGLLDPRRRGESSPKLESLFEMLEEVVEAGHKALVFSQFTSFLGIVRDRVQRRGLVHAYLDGQCTAQLREQEIARFQEHRGCSLFLLSLKAGGVGLNLTAADYVFLLDPWWNPAVEAQAIGRAHRIGQTRSVFAYRFECRDTIEERVLELQARKRELASAILDGEATTLRDLTRADLERLLG